MTVTGDALTGYRIELITLVKEIDSTGNQNTIITGLKTAIGVLPTSEHGNVDYLVLENASTGPFFGGPGLLLRFGSPVGPPTVVASCLTRPTAMTLDPKNSTVYITDLTGRLLTVPLVP